MVYYNKALGTQGLRVAAKRRGIAQLVEQRSPKPRAEGSNPLSSSKLCKRFAYRVFLS